MRLPGPIDSVTQRSVHSGGRRRSGSFIFRPADIRLDKPPGPSVPLLLLDTRPRQPGKCQARDSRVATTKYVFRLHLTLWSRGTLTGVVDWTGGSWGLAAVDVAHMRWNLALTYGLDAADAFLRLHRSLSSNASDDQHYWDLVTVLDSLIDLDPGEWSGFDLERLERYVETGLAHAP